MCIISVFLQKLSQKVQDSIARANDAAGEAVSGIRTVKSFNAKQSEKCRYDERLMATHNIKTQRDSVRALYLLLRRVYDMKRNHFSFITFIFKATFSHFMESLQNHNYSSLFHLQLTELGVTVAMLYYGRLFVMYGQMTTGNLVSFILYQTELAENIRV